MHKKTLIIFSTILLILIGYRFSNDHGFIGQSIAEEHSSAQCYLDARGLSLVASSSDFSSDEEIVTAVFNNLMDVYADTPKCREVDLMNYKLTSLTISSSTDRQIMSDITYDVEPSNVRNTGWIHSGTKDGFWIRDIKASLNIYRTSNGFYLSV